MPENKVVYRSTHPDVLAHLDKYANDWSDWRDRVTNAIRDLGFEAGRNLWMGGNTVRGVMHQPGDPIPDGWRIDRDSNGDAIVPARRSQPGKLIGQRLDMLRRPDPRRRLPGGMPESAWAIGEFTFTRMDCGLKQVGDVIFVTWPREIRSSDADQIDPEMWERIRLSEYYTAIEAADA